MQVSTPNKTGAAQIINSKQIADQVSHGIADVARLNPQLTTTNSGAMSFAGTSNRYNSFMIGSAANNDVFGLLVMERMVLGKLLLKSSINKTIEQIRVNVAHTDVRQELVLLVVYQCYYKWYNNFTVVFMALVTIRTWLDQNILSQMVDLCSKVYRNSIISETSNLGIWSDYQR